MGYLQIDTAHLDQSLSTIYSFNNLQMGYRTLNNFYLRNSNTFYAISGGTSYNVTTFDTLLYPVSISYDNNHFNPNNVYNASCFYADLPIQTGLIGVLGVTLNYYVSLEQSLNLVASLSNLVAYKVTAPISGTAMTLINEASAYTQNLIASATLTGNLVKIVLNATGISYFENNLTGVLPIMYRINGTNITGTNVIPDFSSDYIYYTHKIVHVGLAQDSYEILQ